jgi:signal transduction histidine kinase/CheY-like chemotaxis protein
MSAAVLPSVETVRPGHVVEFFEPTAFPAHRIANRFAEMLGSGGAVVVLATRDHVEQIVAALAAHHVKPDVRDRRLIVLDADAIYAELRLAAVPSEVLDARIAAPLRELVTRFGKACAYGELVDVYCRHGDRDGAIALERWWNVYLQTLPIELWCGYRVDSFDDADSIHAFRGICDQHARVLADGSGPHDAIRLGVELRQISTILGAEVARRIAFENDATCTREQLLVLQRVTSALSEAATFDDIGSALHRVLAPGIRAKRVGLVVGERVVLGTLSAEILATLETSPSWSAHEAVVPLVIASHRIGTLLVAFGDTPGVDQYALVESVARQVALAVERARLYEETEQLRVRAETANRAKDRFLAVLGHELRNPLSPILTAAQLMRLRAPDQLAAERAAIERSATHMSRLIDDLLDVSRIVNGKLDVVRSPAEISEIISTAIELASGHVEDRGHRLHLDCESGLVVEADRARMAQVISNLIVNAARYMKVGGLIEVSARERDGLVEVCVHDDGMGIDPDVLPRIFESFVQGAQDDVGFRGGLGLGLAIARSIVELHDGTIHAESAGRGSGSTFTVKLPRHDVSPPPAAGERSDPSCDRTASRKILVVDDNEDAAWLLAEALRLLGHDVRVAHDGVTALEVAASWPPEIAFLDLGLPGLDGYALGTRLRELPAPPRLFAVTGYGQASDRERTRSVGFDAHFVKPVSLRQIQLAIEGAPPTAQV